MARTTAIQDKEIGYEILCELNTADLTENNIRERLGEVDYSFVIEYIRKNFNPDDVFSIDDLDKWATDSGLGKLSDD